MVALSAPTAIVCPGTSTRISLFGTSSPNSTATTPGTSRAAAASRRVIRALGICERTSRACSIPEKARSPAYRVVPAIFSAWS
jgi:hypothetical protein